MHDNNEFYSIMSNVKTTEEIIEPPRKIRDAEKLISGLWKKSLKKPGDWGMSWKLQTDYNENWDKLGYHTYHEMNKRYQVIIYPCMVFNQYENWIWRTPSLDCFSTDNLKMRKKKIIEEISNQEI